MKTIVFNGQVYLLTNKHIIMNKLTKKKSKIELYSSYS